MRENMLAECNDELSDVLTALDKKLANLESEFRQLVEQKVELLQKKLGRLDEILTQRSQVIEEINNLLKLLPGLVPLPEIELQERAPQKAIGINEFADLTNWEAAREVLRREGRPMYTGEIAEKVTAGGKNLGYPPSSKLNAAMRQKPDVFASEKRRNKSVWSLREWTRDME